MSTKATIFLTKDNEHCYEEGTPMRWQDGPEIVRDVIVMEINKDNAEVIEDEDGYVLYIKPGSEFYNQLLKLRKTT